MVQVHHIANRDSLTVISTAGPRGVGSQPLYSVILVVLDDLGVEWLDYHGIGELYATGLADSTDEFQYFNTPRLTALAGEGVYFSEFYATCLCSTSRSRIHTGKRLDEVGVGANVRGPATAIAATTYPTAGITINASNTFLAEHLTNEIPGISTAHFGKWHMCDNWSAVVADGGATHPPDANLTSPATFGFTTSTWGPVPYGGRYSFWKVVNGTPTYIDGEGTATYTEATYASAVFTTAATVWLAAQTDRFFMSVSLDPPHMPEDVPPYSLLSASMQAELTTAGLAAGHRLDGSADNQTARNDPDFYLCLRAAAEAMDTLLGRIIDAIPTALRPTTHIIVLSDNGGTPSMIPEGFSASGKGTLTRGGTSCTLVVNGPTVARPGREVKTMCDVGDIYATITEIMGASSAESGVSFAAALRDDVDRDDAQAIKDYSIEQLFFPLGVTSPASFVASSRYRSITDGRWRLIVEPSTRKLFDTREDPLELSNLYSATDMDTDSQEAHDRLYAALIAELPT